MALECFVDAFNIGTGGVGSTVVRTGYGFQPKACLYWWTGRTESAVTFARKTLQPGLGIATAPTVRACVTTMSVDNAANMVTARRQSTDACIECLTTARALEGAADLQSFDSNGQTLVIDAAFTTNLRVHCLALGGSDVTDATVATFRAPATTGAQQQDITSVGFEPTALVFLSVGMATAPPSIGSDGTMCVGVATSASTQGVLSYMDKDLGASGSTGDYHYSGECVAIQETRITASFRATFTSFLSTGFRLNWLEVANTTQPYVFALALRGGGAVVGHYGTPTSVTTLAQTGFGFAPTGVLMLANSDTESAQDAPTILAVWNIGAGISGSVRVGQTMVSQNSGINAICGSALREEACLWLVSSATLSAAVVDLVSMDSDGFTIGMDATDAGVRLVTYLAFGSSGGGPPPSAYPQPFVPPRMAVHRAAIF